MKKTMELTRVEMGTDWRGEYLEWVARQGAGRLTIAAYRQDLGAFERWFALVNDGAGLTPEGLTSWDLRAYRSWCLDVARVKPATWNRRRAGLRRLCDWARERGYLLTSPMQGVERAAQARQAPRWLTQQEFRALLVAMERGINAADTEQRRALAVRDAAMVGLMLFAALREAEVCALRVEDIQIGERKGSVWVRGKGEKGRRVPLAREGRELLRLHLAGRADGSAFGVTTRAVQRRVAALGAAAGIEGLTPHRLRHTCAKRMVDAGVNLGIVKEILGHARLDTTLIYTAPGAEDLERAVELVALGGMNKREEVR